MQQFNFLLGVTLWKLVNSIAIYNSTDSDQTAIPFLSQGKGVVITKSIGIGGESVGQPSLNQTGDSVAFLSASESAATLTAIIKIGNPPQPLKVLFDTGSTLFWVMASNCQTYNCDGYENYNHSASSAYKALPIPKRSSQQYGDGSSIQCQVSGSDLVSIGGIQVQNQPICEAFSVFGITDIQGIIGIGPPQFIGNSYADLMVGLSTKKSLKRNVMAMWFNTNDSAEIAGEIQFGDLDSSKFVGDINYYNISSRRDYWRLSLDNITFSDDQNYFAFPTNFSKSIVIDSGTTYALLPADLAKAVNVHIGATTIEQGLYTIDCNQALLIPPLKFYFSGNPNPLIFEGRQLVRFVPGDRTHYSVCVSIFQESKVNMNNQYVSIFGALFIRNFFTVFNYDHATIGFGKAIGLPPPNARFSSAFPLVDPTLLSLLLLVFIPTFAF